MFSLGLANAMNRKRLYTKGAFGSLGLLTGAAGIVYQYIIALVLSYLMGNTIIQVTMVTGIMMLMMFAVCRLQARLKRRLAELFIGIELALALLGGFAPLLLQWLFVKSPESIDFFGYGYSAVIGFLIGIEIPLIMRLNEKFTNSLGQNIADTWALDYLGAVIGSAGLITLFKFGVSITSISFVTAMVNIAVAIVGLVFFWQQKMLSNWITKSLLMFVTIVTTLATFTGLSHADSLERIINQKLYNDPVIFETTTPYQRIVMTQGPHPTDPMDYNYELYLNGNKQFASSDEEKYHELLVHPAMEMAAARQRVLILGGGDGLALREVLKYDDVQEVTLVDLDPGMIELASTNEILRELNDDAFADARVRSSLDNSTLDDGVITDGTQADVHVHTGEERTVCGTAYIDGVTSTCTSEPVTEIVATVNVYTIDANKFITEAAGYYDVVIVDMPDPNSEELAKLYSVEFYSKIRAVLSPGGIVTVQATSPIHAKETFLCILRTMTAAGLNSLPYHENIPSFGEWAWIMGSPTQPAQDLYTRIDNLESFDVPTEATTASGLTRTLIFPDPNQFETFHNTINTVMNPVIEDYYNGAWRTD